MKRVVSALAVVGLAACAGVSSFTPREGSAANLNHVSKLKLDSIPPSGQIGEVMETQLIKEFVRILTQEMEKKGYAFVRENADAIVSGKILEVKVGSSGGRVAAEFFFGAIGRKMAAAKFNVLMTVKDTSGKTIFSGEAFGNHEVGGSGEETEIMEAVGRSAKAFSGKFMAKSKPGR